MCSTLNIDIAKQCTCKFPQLCKRRALVEMDKNITLPISSAVDAEYELLSRESSITLANENFAEYLSHRDTEQTEKTPD
jgi:hypothetical protein